MYQLDHVAGVDEVGRGSLAGAVFAAAVVLNPFRHIHGLQDSKVLTAKKRIELDAQIRSQALDYSIAQAGVAEIDQLNILQASFLAMQRAITGLRLSVDFVLVDGNQTPDFGVPSAWLIKGDSKHDSIKAASIIAKVARDQAMLELDKIHPQYGLSQHKGYPTAAHLAALKNHGPCPIHRMSFTPCRQAQQSRPVNTKIR